MIKTAYYNYHATAKQLIKGGKLTAWYYTEKHNQISPALVLMFDDAAHPVMPIREYCFAEYMTLLPAEKKRDANRASLLVKVHIQNIK